LGSEGICNSSCIDRNSGFVVSAQIFRKPNEVLRDYLLTFFLDKSSIFQKNIKLSSFTMNSKGINKI